MKYTPRSTVRAKETLVWVWLPLISLWWAQVTLTPEDNKITVFSKGTPNGLKAKIPNGGHSFPSSTFTAKLLWKKAQKKEIKKNTSETINKIIPQRKPSSTIDVWYPINEPSRLTSRHHWKETKNKNSILNRSKSAWFSWNHFNKPEVRPRPLNVVNIFGVAEADPEWALSVGMGLTS